MNEPSEQRRKSKVLMDGEQIGRTLARMTHEIAEQAPDLTKLALVGIHSGGVDLAARLSRALQWLLPGRAPDRSHRHHLLS